MNEILIKYRGNLQNGAKIRRIFWFNFIYFDKNSYKTIHYARLIMEMNEIFNIWMIVRFFELKYILIL